MVDDGSSDGTINVVKKYKFVKCIRHKTNQGKGAALRTGFNVSKGDILLIQDADLEYSPLDIPKLIAPLLSDKTDVVYGSRFKGCHNGMSLTHFIGNRILSLATSLLFWADITDVMTGYKCFSRRVIDSLDFSDDGFNIEVDMTASILKKGWKVSEVPIQYSKRNKGNSKIKNIDGVKSLLKLFVKALQNA